MDEVTYTWCHGPTGTSLLFTALEHAGVDAVAGETPAQWQRRCLHSIRTSGIPERLRPGFWDNDGRCCGTAGVGDVFLDAWQRRGVDDDLAFAQVLGDALVARAVVDGDRACWRFTEHRNEDPLLPPGVGWMQGTAGIAAYLLRLGRVLREGVRRPPSRASTPGGTCRDRARPHLRIRRGGLRALPTGLPGRPGRRGAGVRRPMPVATALEIGAGTGKATRVFAAHGVEVTATEPDAAMLAELRRQVPGVATVRAAFEDLPLTTTYDLVYAAAALHWTRPEGGGSASPRCSSRAASWRRSARPATSADPALEEAVRAARAPWLADDDVPPPDGTPEDSTLQWPSTELSTSGLFTDVTQVVLEQRTTVSARDYVGLLSTVSAYLELEPADREAALAERPRRAARAGRTSSGTSGCTSRGRREAEACDGGRGRTRVADPVRVGGRRSIRCAG